MEFSKRKRMGEWESETAGEGEQQQDRESAQGRERARLAAIRSLFGLVFGLDLGSGFWVLGSARGTRWPCFLLSSLCSCSLLPLNRWLLRLVYSNDGARPVPRRI